MQKQNLKKCIRDFALLYFCNHNVLIYKNKKANQSNNHLNIINQETSLNVHLYELILTNV